MTLLKIYTVPHPVLRKKAAPVAKVDERVATLLRDMLETMYAGHGCGLAGNQVGVLERLVVIDVSEKRDRKNPLLMANPVITWKTDKLCESMEGCLSIPEQFAKVHRAERVRVSYLDEHNQPQEIEGDDLLSQALQHEIDHLDGVLFFDYLSTLRRNMMTRRVQKLSRLFEEPDEEEEAP